MREDDLATSLTSTLTRLQNVVADYGSALLAFSGGVDSALVVRVAHDVLGDRLTALTSVSPTNPEEDTAEAVTLAGTLGVRHVVVDSNELEIPGYAANPIDRCFLCKDRLYEICTAEAHTRGIAVIMDGVNVDDLGDYRPGLRAADAFGIRHPLVEADLTKRDVRALSRALGLVTWDRPASPCLSSRFPYGTTITRAGLRKVAEAENALRRLGFRTLRVRFHGDHARVEIDSAELPRLEDPTTRAAAVASVQAAGFADVTIDPAGFRSGGLNVDLGARTVR
mgnify:CR=1 FL=1